MGRFWRGMWNTSACQADCSKIMLLSNSKRSEAHTFFEKQGFSSELKKGFVKYRSQLRHE
jgi:hypothetical protein